MTSGKHDRRVSVVLLPMLIRHLNKSWSAVARGAAIRGLKLSRAIAVPDSTIAKENFGVVATDGTIIRLLSEARFAVQASSPVLTRRGPSQHSPLQEIRQKNN